MRLGKCSSTHLNAWEQKKHILKGLGLILFFSKNQGLVFCSFVFYCSSDLNAHNQPLPILDIAMSTHSRKCRFSQTAMFVFFFLGMKQIIS